MIIIPPNWILVRNGFLFGAPLLSDWLLYRFYDLDCSILLQHDPVTKIRSSAKISSQIFSAESSFKGVDRVHLHFAESANASLSTLLKKPAVCVSICDGSDRNFSIGGISFAFVQDCLSTTDWIMAAPDLPSREEYQIGKSDYWVCTETRLGEVGKAIQGYGLEETKNTLSIKPWTIGATNEASGVRYDFDCLQQWSLASSTNYIDALKTTEAFRPDVYVVKGSRAKTGEE